MVVMHIAAVQPENPAKTENPAKAHQTKFTFSGEEMIEKVVKPGGNAGRVYLPQDWVGKLVKIVRID